MWSEKMGKLCNIGWIVWTCVLCMLWNDLNFATGYPQILKLLQNVFVFVNNNNHTG